MKNNKKIYGLALGGGAAKSYTQIGVIKYLEENNIEVGEIAGTSMGALIGALYAMGKKFKDLEEIAREVKYSKMIDLDFKNGILKGEKAKKVLEKYFGDLNIEELPIKLKIVAFNIESGEKKIFESGRIVDAIRASISIPWLFKPYKIGDEFFIDGGAISNLPIDELSLDNKIAVSAMKLPDGSLMTNKKGFIKTNYQIFYRAITYMMNFNEEVSIERATGNKQVLKFDFGNLDSGSFKEVDSLINLGYETAKKNLNF